MQFLIYLAVTFAMSFAIVSNGSLAFAQTLTERALYQRCYAKLVRTTPTVDDPFVTLIETEAMKGAEACKALVRLAKFESDHRISRFVDSRLVLAQRVLHSMHDLHASWFSQKYFEHASTCYENAVNSLLDPQEPALFFTAALFDGRYDLSWALTSRQNLRAIRTEDSPQQSIFGSEIAFNKAGAPTGFTNFPPNYRRLISNGILLGVTDGDNPIVSSLQTLVRVPGDSLVEPPVVRNYKVKENRGGGIIGSQAYLMVNYGEAVYLRPNLEKMPRSWSKHVFEDLLCRSLPVILPEDADAYTVCPTCAIKPSVAEARTVLPFRQNRSCVQCHASMDQIGGLVRGFRGYRTGDCNSLRLPPHEYSTLHLVEDVPTLPLDTKWGYIADPLYRRKPAYGKFLFRNYKNQKIDVNVSSLAQLGAEIAKTDDFYICAAKRYYQYFTGIDVNIGPVATALPRDQKFYRDRVVGLGLKLKDPAQFNKNPLKLIEAIFDLPEYKKKDMNLLQAAQVP